MLLIPGCGYFLFCSSAALVDDAVVRSVEIKDEDVHWADAEVEVAHHVDVVHRAAVESMKKKTAEVVDCCSAGAASVVGRHVCPVRRGRREPGQEDDDIEPGRLLRGGYGATDFD